MSTATLYCTLYINICQAFSPIYNGEVRYLAASVHSHLHKFIRWNLCRVWHHFNSWLFTAMHLSNCSLWISICQTTRDSKISDIQAHVKKLCCNCHLWTFFKFFTRLWSLLPDCGCYGANRKRWSCTEKSDAVEVVGEKNQTCLLCIVSHVSWHVFSCKSFLKHTLQQTSFLWQYFNFGPYECLIADSVILTLPT